MRIAKRHSGTNAVPGELLAMTGSPAMAVVKRESLSGLRGARPFLFLAVMLVIMIGGLIFMLDLAMDRYLQSGGAMGGQQVRFLFTAFSLTLYFSAILLVPPMAAVSICTEKQQDSYDLLLMTYIRPLSLALAKLLNVLGIYGLIVIATMPIVGVFFFLVGIDWVQFTHSAIIIMMSTLSCAAIGLLCSAWFYRTLPAVITAFVATLLLHGGLLLGFLLFAQLTLGPMFLSRLLRGMDEFLVVVPCPFASLTYIGSGFYSLAALIGTIIYHGCIVFICLLKTLAILRRPPKPMRVETERPIDDQEILKARRRKFPYYLLDPRRRRPMIPDERNPLLSKELQTGLIGRGSYAVRIFYIFTLFSFMISIFSVVAIDFRVRSYGPFIGWPALIDTVFILILTPTLIATAMAKEYEWGNMDMLRMTLIKPGEIIAGKFRTALYTASLPVVGALLGLTPLMLYSYNISMTWAGLAGGLGNTVVSVIFVLCLTLFVTVRSRQSVSGLLLGYGASIGALVLLPAALMVLWMVLSGNQHPPESIEDAIFFSSPLTAQIQNLYGIPRYGETTLMTRYWLLNCVCFTVIAAALLHSAKKRFIQTLQWGER